MRTPALFYVLLCLVTALWCGCTVTLGDGSTPLDDSTWNGNGSGEAPRLPEPTTWRVPPPQLTPEQQQRQTEVDQFVLANYGDYRIVETTQGYSGDIVDWVDSATIPGASLTPPPPTWTQADLTPSPGAQLARPELEMYPELRGPAGTTPIQRPDFSRYVMSLTGATSLQDYLDNHQVAGQPENQNRLYAGLVSPLPNMGASGTINQFQGDVEQGTFSLIEVAVFCRGLNQPKTVQLVGAVVSRDRANIFGDGQPRIHTERMTAGEKSIVWDESSSSGFIPYPGRPYGPGGVVPVSAPGLGAQQENRIDISQDASGNWWISHNGNVLGHYPASLVTMLNGLACEAAWYGEVYDPTPTDWTWTDMGSGEFPDVGYGYASYVRDPKFRDLLYTPQDPLEDYTPRDRFSMSPSVPACYTRSKLTVGIPPSGRYIYLSGPGGDAAGCD